MRSIDEKPYIELLEGRAVEKVSPKRVHAVLQWRLAALLQSHAGDRGDVGTEWRFWLSALDDPRTSLVPDVAFVSHARLDSLNRKQREEPPFAPDVAIEIRSPEDKPKNVEWKMRAYLSKGGIVAFDVLPEERIIRAFMASGVTALSIGERFTCADLPWLEFDVADVFSNIPH